MLALCTFKQIKHVKFDCKLCTYAQLIFYNVWNHAFSLLAVATVNAAKAVSETHLKVLDGKAATCMCWSKKQGQTWPHIQRFKTQEQRMEIKENTDLGYKPK